jgi:predicted Zn-dependent peptidase
MWPSQPLGESVLGTFESIVQMKRHDLVSFKEDFYTSSNIVVSAAGSFNYDKLIGRTKRIFSGLKKTGDNLFIPAIHRQCAPQLRLMDKDTEQSHMAMGFHSFKRDHELKHALGLLNIILGANMSSRLFNEVREKRGLAYEIGTQVKKYQDTGAFIVHAGIDNEKVLSAVDLILKELCRVKDGLVVEDEFKRAKDFYLGQLMLALEDTLDNMFWIGETTAALDKTYTLADIIKEVAKVKREDLREVARAVFHPKNLNLALIGPLKDKESAVLKALNSGIKP